MSFPRREPSTCENAHPCACPCERMPTARRTRGAPPPHSCSMHTDPPKQHIVFIISSGCVVLEDPRASCRVTSPGDGRPTLPQGSGGIPPSTLGMYLRGWSVARNVQHGAKEHSWHTVCAAASRGSAGGQAQTTQYARPSASKWMSKALPRARLFQSVEM